MRCLSVVEIGFCVKTVLHVTFIYVSCPVAHFRQRRPTDLRRLIIVHVISATACVASVDAAA